MRIAFAFLALWAGLILEATVFQIPPFSIVHPNLVLVILVIVALTRGPKTALVFGILIGIIQDVDYGQFIGLNAFAYGVVGYFAATAFMQFLHRNIAITFLITVIFTFIHVWITYGMTRMFDVTAYSGSVVLTKSLWQMIMNGILVLLFYPWMTKWFTDRSRGKYADVDADRAS
jgi:rod shape-determining protein MreD